ncbi:solute carrier family 49 member A3 [Protobothrops mucrosquamatus]|uniref:solute carrier family 49 member A3 n=1 Tax=Protobothrops mucrosquamatus TaxID=103944 RepID=UPI0007755E39|nr:solute carrier family 49 member A3 [Protobothrops mucrosquamatus]
MDDSRCIDQELQPSSEQAFKAYKRRWVILAAVCVVNCSNAMLWLTFAPVADITAERFHTSLDMVNWLSIVYFVVSVPVGLLAIWILDTIGLRCAVLLCAWLNMVGSIIRVFSVIDSLSLGSLNYIYLLVGQCLCAGAQPLIIFAPTKLAALWFPEDQRATANMIASMSNPLGMLVVNLLSPTLAPEAKDLPLLIGVSAVPAILGCLLSTFGVCSGVPPTPPSASADHLNSPTFCEGLKMLVRNKPYIILTLCFATGVALFTCLSSLLEQILCVNGYSNFFAGLTGALFIIFGLIGAFFLGLYVDRTKKFTETTKISFILSALTCIGFAVVSQMRDQTYAVAIFSSLFGLFGFSMYPIVMELNVECSYPVGEGTSSGIIFVTSQILGVLFILLFQNLAVEKKNAPFSTCAPSLGPPMDWTNATLVMAGITTLTSCLFIVTFHTNYKRISAETSQSSSINKTEDDDVAVTA